MRKRASTLEENILTLISSQHSPLHHEVYGQGQKVTLSKLFKDAGKRTIYYNSQKLQKPFQ